MKNVKIGKYNVLMYESIDELPIVRFHKFNKYVLVDSGIGSDLNDVNNHISRISKFIHTDKNSALRELENLRNSLYLVLNEVGIKHLSFVMFIHSINGKEVHDLSDENVKVISAKLNKVKVNYLDHLIEMVKKKIDEELNIYFPNQFDNSATKEFYDTLKQRSLLELDAIIRGNDNEDEIKKIDDYFILSIKPKSFGGKTSAEVQYDKQFDEMCIFIKKTLSSNPEKMTVLQFYSSLEFIKKNRPKKKK